MPKLSWQDRTNLIRNAAIQCHSISHGAVAKDIMPNEATLSLLENQIKGVLIAIADAGKAESDEESRRLHSSPVCCGWYYDEQEKRWRHPSQS